MSLSLVAQFDDLVRCTNALLDNRCEEAFLKYVKNQEECRKKWHSSVLECQRLQASLEKANAEISRLESNLTQARRILDQERKQRKQVEIERDNLDRNIMLVRELLWNQGNANINAEAKEKLAFLNTRTQRKSRFSLGVPGRVSNTTGSILSDMSYSRSEEDIDESMILPRLRKRSAVQSENFEDPKKRKSSGGRKEYLSSENPPRIDVTSYDQNLVATTTVTVSSGGPIKATSKIETKSNATPIPSAPPFKLDSESEGSNWTPISRINSKTKPELIQKTPFLPFGSITNRAHIFVSKSIIRPEECGYCNNKIKFGKMAVKCKTCGVICHTDCKVLMPLPCIPPGNTPTGKGKIAIAELAPRCSPMIPSIIIHCVNAIEKRGLNEVGIYRISGSEKEVKALKEKFLRGRGSPNLDHYDIHVVCSVVKHFLRNLREPLVTSALLKNFGKAVEERDPQVRSAIFFQIISQLPQPNRDTLAFFILHLQRVSLSPECKMSVMNLSKVLAPAIVGFSSDDPQIMFRDIDIQVKILEQFLSIPSDYWYKFVSPEDAENENEIFDSPSTDRHADLHIGSSRVKLFSQMGETPRGMFGHSKKFFEDTPPIHG